MSVAVGIFIISFYGFWEIQLFETNRNRFVMSDCKGNSVYEINSAYNDYLLPRKDGQMQGLMACYCKQQFDLYESAALKITFEDGEQYCKNWYASIQYTNYVIFLQTIWISIVNYSV